jgi:hypothetical protein
VTRLDRLKRGSGIKGREDRSSGVEIRITDVLAKINPTEPLNNSIGSCAKKSKLF